MRRHQYLFFAATFIYLMVFSINVWSSGALSVISIAVPSIVYGMIVQLNI